MKKTNSNSSTYQIKVTLLDVRPIVFRRLLLSSALTLRELHNVLQTAMGWTNSHMHQFVSGETYYGQPVKGLEEGMVDERKVSLGELLRQPKDAMFYEYDFGDSWMHKIVLEKILPADKEQKPPLCLGGARACPPDDCGGPPGYANLLQAIANRDHPEHKELLAWLGGEFDPEHFDLAAVNDALAGKRPSRTWQLKTTR